MYTNQFLEIVEGEGIYEVVEEGDEYTRELIMKLEEVEA